MRIVRLALPATLSLVATIAGGCQSDAGSATDTHSFVDASQDATDDATDDASADAPDDTGDALPDLQIDSELDTPDTAPDEDATSPADVVFPDTTLDDVPGDVDTADEDASSEVSPDVEDDANADALEDTAPDEDSTTDPDGTGDPDASTAEDTTADALEDTADADSDVEETVAGPIVSLRATVQPTATAGDTLAVQCIGVRPDGTDAGLFPTPVWATRPAGAIATLGPDLEARRAGIAYVRCGDPEMTLPFSVEAEVEISPAGADQTITIAETVAPIAGSPFEVTCESSDRFGNTWIDTEAFVDVSPDSQPIEREGQRLTLTLAGDSVLTCQTPATTLESAEVRVQPGPPSSWSFRVGSRPYVRVGFPVAPNPTVRDAYGNEITTPAVLESIRWSTDPPPDGTDGFSFTFETEGYYTMFGSLDLPSGETSTLERPFLIHGIEPKVSCTWPAIGEMIEAVPGSTIRIRGTSQDTFAPHSVRVNLEPASFDEDGNWEIDWVVKPGINSYDVRVGEGPPGVLDPWRAWGVQVCSFLAAPSYIAHDDEVPRGLVFRLGPDALDDGEREDPPSSLADLLASSVATPGFIADVDEALRDSNPLFSGCIQTSPFGCLATATINYTGGLAITGASDVQIDTRSSYLRLAAELTGNRLNIAVNSSALGSATAVIRTSSIGIVARVTGSIVGGRPVLRISRVDDVTVAPMTATFSGSNASVYSAAFSIAEPSLRAELVAAIEDVVANSLDDVLRDAFSGLDLEDMRVETLVAPVGDGVGVTAEFVPRATALTTNTQGLAVTMATVWNLIEPSAEPAPFPLLSPGPALTGQRDFAFGVRLDAINQGFHMLWRTGFFDYSLGVFEVPPILGEFDDGAADLSFVTLLPPQFSIRDGELVLSLGAMRTDFITRAFQDRGIDYEGVFAADLVATVVVGDDGSMSVGSLEVLNIWGSVKNWDMDDGSIDILLGFLRGRVESIASLDVLGSLDGFVLPRFLGTTETAPIGVPPGSSFGIASPEVSLETNALVISGVGGVE